jgi:hypothetical protein
MQRDIVAAAMITGFRKLVKTDLERGQLLEMELNRINNDLNARRNIQQGENAAQDPPPSIESQLSAEESDTIQRIARITARLSARGIDHRSINRIEVPSQHSEVPSSGPASEEPSVD